MTFLRPTPSLLALAFGLALTACGGGAADGEAPAATATATQVPSIEATDPMLRSDTDENGELIASTRTS